MNVFKIRRMSSSNPGLIENYIVLDEVPPDDGDGADPMYVYRTVQELRAIALDFDIGYYADVLNPIPVIQAQPFAP